MGEKCRTDVKSWHIGLKKSSAKARAEVQDVWSQDSHLPAQFAPIQGHRLMEPSQAQLDSLSEDFLGAGCLLGNDDSIHGVLYGCSSRYSDLLIIRTLSAFCLLDVANRISICLFFKKLIQIFFSNKKFDFENSSLLKTISSSSCCFNKTYLTDLWYFQTGCWIFTSATKPKTKLQQQKTRKNVWRVWVRLASQVYHQHILCRTFRSWEAKCLFHQLQHGSKPSQPGSRLPTFRCSRNYKKTGGLSCEVWLFVGQKTLVLLTEATHPGVSIVLRCLQFFPGTCRTLQVRPVRRMQILFKMMLQMPTGRAKSRKPHSNRELRWFVRRTSPEALITHISVCKLNLIGQNHYQSVRQIYHLFWRT